MGCSYGWISRSLGAHVFIPCPIEQRRSMASAILPCLPARDNRGSVKTVRLHRPAMGTDGPGWKLPYHQWDHGAIVT